MKEIVITLSRCGQFELKIDLHQLKELADNTQILFKRKKLLKQEDGSKDFTYADSVERSIAFTKYGWEKSNKTLESRQVMVLLSYLKLDYTDSQAFLMTDTILGTLKNCQMEKK